MSDWENRIVRAGARLLGFPPGMGVMLSRPVRRRLIWSLTVSVLLSALDMLGVLALVPMMQFIADVPSDTGALGVINRALGNPDQDVLVAVLAGLVATAFVLKDVVAVVVRRWQLRFMADQEVEISRRMLTGYLVGPYSWHLVKNTSDKLWTVDYAVSVGYTTGITAALGAVTEVFTIALIFIALMFVSPVATLAAVLYFGVAGLTVQRSLRRRIAAAGAAATVGTQAAAKTSLQALGAAKEIKLRHAEERFVEEYAGSRRAGARARATATLLNEIPKYLLEAVFVVGIGLLALGVVSTSGSQDALVVLGVFVAAGSRILPSAVRLIAAMGGIRYSRQPLGHLVGEFAAQQAAQSEDQAEVTTERVPTGDIRIRDLTFSYDDEPNTLVLGGVDCLIEAGRTAAIVGSSGAGKSTLVDLMLGLHRPRGGSICAGDVDIRTNLPGWQEQLAVVPQDVYLLDESLRDNIAFDEEADEQRLADALMRAQLADLVGSLPAGLDTLVGDRGVRLSGGQRQRIGIARALYRRPDVLFLDEATSALDNETERRLSRTIAALRGSMTIIIVAHRLSTVRDCDQLLFMSNGKVATSGTFDEVAERNAEFAHLVELGSLTASTAGRSVERS